MPTIVRGHYEALLEPLANAISRHVVAVEAIFADDTPVKLQAPGTGKTKTGQLRKAGITTLPKCPKSHGECHREARGDFGPLFVLQAVDSSREQDRITSLRNSAIRKMAAVSACLLCCSRTTNVRYLRIDRCVWASVASLLRRFASSR